MAQPFPSEMDDLLFSWPDSAMKNAFVHLAEQLAAEDDVQLDFKARPGVSYSLRGKRDGQSQDLMTMIDVIDDDPENRWLSVCFFADMITDPEEKGDIVPGGLLGQDGYCFDVDTPDPDEVQYVAERLQEAYAKALG